MLIYFGFKQIKIYFTLKKNVLILFENTSDKSMLKQV